jgi:diacylglycerol O-acyltransferase-1
LLARSTVHSLLHPCPQIFHVWLNLMGELTGFADRSFYRAWWNASSLDQFWRLWNMPVHNFLMRTVYFPLIRMGINK